MPPLELNPESELELELELKNENGQTTGSDLLLYNILLLFLLVLFSPLLFFLLCFFYIIAIHCKLFVGSEVDALKRRSHSLSLPLSSLGLAICCLKSFVGSKLIVNCS